VDKTYLVGIRKPLPDDAQKALEKGVDIGEDKPTRPAKVEVLSDSQILLTIHEGKFHQVKRMLKAVDNEVVSLKRVTFGPLQLDGELQPGGYRELTNGEVAKLHAAQNVGK